MAEAAEREQGDIRPARRLEDKFRSRGCENEDRQRLDKLQDALEPLRGRGIGPVHVLEDNKQWPRGRPPAEEAIEQRQYRRTPRSGGKYSTSGDGT